MLRAQWLLRTRRKASMRFNKTTSSWMRANLDVLKSVLPSNGRMDVPVVSTSPPCKLRQSDPTKGVNPQISPDSLKYPGQSDAGCLLLRSTLQSSALSSGVSY